MNDYILFKNLDGKYLTLPECLEIKPQDEENTEEGDGNAENTTGSAVDENGNKKKLYIVSKSSPYLTKLFNDIESWVNKD